MSIQARSPSPETEASPTPGEAFVLPLTEVPVLVITDDSPRAELIEAIGHLRTKQRAVFDAEVKAEIQVAIDECLDRL